MPRIADDFVEVGLFRITHPDPDQIVSLLDRKTANIRLRGYFGLAGNVDAASGAIEQHPVIFAANVVIEDLALRKRHAAVTAAILQRGDAVVRATVHHNGFVQNRAGEGLAGDLVRPAGGVPGVHQIHRCPP